MDSQFWSLILLVCLFLIWLVFGQVLLIIIGSKKMTKGRQSGFGIQCWFYGWLVRLVEFAGEWKAVSDFSISMSNNKFILILLFLPVLLLFLLGWIIYWNFWGKKQAIREQKRQEFKKKLLTHIRNFSPVRLKNRRWRKILDKKPKKSPKQSKDKQK